MSFKILIANIAIGVPGADSPLRSLLTLVRFHGWRVLPFLLTGGRLSGIFDYSARPNKNRLRFASTHSTIRPILALIEKEQPDVIVLNEVLYQVHREPLEAGLKKMGFAHIAWGLSLHYPDVTISTVVASRLPCLDDRFAPTMTQLPQISGGAGIAGLRLKEHPVTIVGFHLTKGLRGLSGQQLEDLDKIYESEEADGRLTILAGDFNEHARFIERVASLKASGLAVFIKVPTTPLGLPKFLEADYDHICLPAGWSADKTTCVSFGSDHLAVITELTGP